MYRISFREGPTAISSRHLLLHTLGWPAPPPSLNLQVLQDTSHASDTFELRSSYPDYPEPSATTKCLLSWEHGAHWSYPGAVQNGRKFICCFDVGGELRERAELRIHGHWLCLSSYLRPRNTRPFRHGPDLTTLHTTTTSMCISTHLQTEASIFHNLFAYLETGAALCTEPWVASH